MNRPAILGIPVDLITFEGLLAQIGDWVQADDGLHQICTVNPEFIMQAQRTPQFYNVLQESALNVADGWGAVWALRLRGIAVPERVTGSDGVPLIAARAAQEGWRLFLLGAGPSVAAWAGEILKSRNPALQIVGVYEGSPAPEEADEIIRCVNEAGTDILLVAYGAPQQDLWIYQHRARLKVKVAMGIGGSLDFIAGVVPRAPRWMRRSGLEWLYRLILQPWRWRRMLVLPLFAVYALIYGGRSPRHAHP